MLLCLVTFFPHHLYYVIRSIAILVLCHLKSIVNNLDIMRIFLLDLNFLFFRFKRKLFDSLIWII